MGTRMNKVTYPSSLSALLIFSTLTITVIMYSFGKNANQNTLLVMIVFTCIGTSEYFILHICYFVSFCPYCLRIDEFS